MEVKQEISKIIDSRLESVLSELLSFLKDVEKASNEQGFSAEDLQRILKEDHELLQELAKRSGSMMFTKYTICS